MHGVQQKGPLEQRAFFISYLNLRAELRLALSGRAILIRLCFRHRRRLKAAPRQTIHG
jgi:hypothetical protein